MNIKLVALDLDRTTLNKDGKLSEGNRMAIVEAMKNGVHVCIASGRAFDTLPSDVISVPGIEYAITSNGAAIYRICDKKCIRSLVLRPSSVERIITTTKDYPVAYEAFVNGIAYAGKGYIDDPVAFGATEYAISYIQKTRNPVADMRTFMMEHRNELDSIDVVVSDETMKEELIRKIKDIDKNVYITSSIKQLIEISYKDAGKKSGVSYLAEKLGISREQIAAFGDADNDMDMIEFAGCGIAMENASPHLKEAADYVTLHHDQDGVAYAFHHILKIC